MTVRFFTGFGSGPVQFTHIFYFRVWFGSWQNPGSCSVRSCWVPLLSRLWYLLTYSKWHPYSWSK